MSPLRPPGCLLACLLAGCSGGASWPKVIDPTDIVEFSEGNPRIGRVRDLGNVHIGKAGPLLAESDGRFTVGELALVEGGGLGKQPTVTVGGRPAEVLWRTQGGGVIFRLPAGVSAGPQRLEVRAGGGRAEAPIGLARLGLLLDGRRG